MALQDLYPLVESVSRAQANSKPDMEATLAAWQRLYQEQQAPPEQQQDLFQARQLLAQSPDLPTFMHQLRASVAPRTVAAPGTPQPSQPMGEESSQQSQFSPR